MLLARLAYKDWGRKSSSRASAYGKAKKWFVDVLGLKYGIPSRVLLVRSLPRLIMCFSANAFL
jgi:hypothetical protein